MTYFSHQEVTGNPNVGFGDEDLEGDFDPVKYDEAMQVHRFTLCIDSGWLHHSNITNIFTHRKHLMMIIITKTKLKSQNLMMMITMIMKKVKKKNAIIWSLTTLTIWSLTTLTHILKLVAINIATLYFPGKRFLRVHHNVLAFIKRKVSYMIIIFIWHK